MGELVRIAAALAAEQHGVAATRQLREVGVGKDLLASWRRQGWIRPVFHGVHAFGPAELVRPRRVVARGAAQRR